MKLVVGLGNPGKKYEGTRHNVGFEVLARLARECGADPPRKKFDGELCECPLGGEKALLLAPQAFMNRSGSSVRQALDFYQATYEDLLVICDEFQLPVGQLRIRSQGTDGGQNGLADVVEIPEEKLIAAVQLYFTLANLKVEPTGALSLAALLERPEMFAEKKICLVVSGGNVDIEIYRQILAI